MLNESKNEQLFSTSYETKRQKELVEICQDTIFEVMELKRRVEYLFSEGFESAHQEIVVKLIELTDRLIRSDFAKLNPDAEHAFLQLETNSEQTKEMIRTLISEMQRVSNNLCK